MFTETDRVHMEHALSLARLGLWTTTPNPRVGCVLVAGGEVVGEGWHRRAGEPHAEVLALAQAGERARGATAYVTLEPCSHFGRTPPCADALIAARVARVVAAMQDPDPRVGGRGLQRLREAGIDVRCGLMQREALELNQGFVRRVTTGRPWVRVKAAASVDGTTALADGQSQWITSPQARRDGHLWRARACAILTGIGTVRADDPRLSVRDVGAQRQPLRVLLDSRLDVSPAAAMLREPGAVVFHADPPGASDRVGALRAGGTECIALPGADGKVDLPAMLDELGQRGINELHVEAGSKLNASLQRAGLVDEWLVYLAPALVGPGARIAELPALPSLDQRVSLEFHDVGRVGPDLRLLLRPAVAAATARGLLDVSHPDAGR